MFILYFFNTADHVILVERSRQLNQETYNLITHHSFSVSTVQHLSGFKHGSDVSILLPHVLILSWSLSHNVPVPFSPTGPARHRA